MSAIPALANFLYRFVGALGCRIGVAGVFSIAMLWLLASLSVSAEPSKRPMNAKWILTAQSDLIARAKLNIPPSALNEKRNGWIDLDAIIIGEPVKGDCPWQPLSLLYYREDSGDSLLDDFLEKSDQEVILFLVQNGSDSYTFARYTPDAVTPFSVDEFSTLESEVNQQQEIGQHFDELPIGKATAADAKIQELFDSLTKTQNQEAAWEKLLKLSRQDVPAIVRSMNDQRRVPVTLDAYVPTPDSHIEARAHYGPPRVIEAASTILPYLTGAWFRFVYNGGSERELLADLYAWRCWCAYNF